MMHWRSVKGLLSGMALFVVWGLAFPQQNVSLTVSLVNPAIPEYELQAVNNNASGWAVDQLHVLYTTPGVLQSTSVPASWVGIWDVPWDAVPFSLRFETSSASDRILPGGGSKTFRFKMNTKTPVADFYVQFRVVQGTESKEYVKRVKIPQPLDVPRDGIQIQQVGVLTPDISGAPQPILRFSALFPIPTLSYEISTLDSVDTLRDSIKYPPTPIPPPPHLEHFFTGTEDRSIATGTITSGSYWTIQSKSAQWMGGTVSISGIRWEHASDLIHRPSACWQFFPSLRTAEGERIVHFRISNCGNVDISGNLLIYLRGERLLRFGEELANWPRQFTPDYSFPLTIQTGGSKQFVIILPANVPPHRFFYGALDVQVGNSRAPTTIRFANQEVEAPILIGFLDSFGEGRPVEVQVRNPNTNLARTFSTTADGNGVWRVYLNSATGPDFFNDGGFYQPVWEVRVKPAGALSTTFQEVLIPGGDTIDPYLRMQVVLGDVNGDDCIDDADLLTVLFNFGTDNPYADLNRDGVVDDADLLIVLFNFGSCS